MNTTAIFDSEVQVAVAQGWRVEALSPTQAVLVKGSKPNHVLHVILSVLTLGLWIPVWIALAIIKGEKRKTITAPSPPPDLTPPV